MRPINIVSLKASYINFVIHFTLLIAFSLCCLFFYYNTKKIDFLLINRRLELVNKQEEARKKVNAELLGIRKNLESISRVHSVNLEDLDDQYNALAIVKEKATKINELVTDMDPKTVNYSLYKTLSENLTPMVVTQDSLFMTRFEIQSIKEQLDACLRTYDVAKSKLRGGLLKSNKR